MSKSFTISAPGKIILFGEHSVVYGKTALAASVDLRTYLKYQSDSNSDVVVINFSSINLHHKFHLESLNEFLNQTVPHHSSDISPNSIDHDQFLIQVKSFIDTKSDTKTLNDAQKSSLHSFVYLLTAILSSNDLKKLGGFSLTLTSDMRVGSGLGSSASFAVCLAGCFYHLAHACTKLKFDYNDMELISGWAYCSEKIMHGNPSGLDNCVSTFGSIVKFRKTEQPKPLFLENDLNALLVDTAVPRQTIAMVSIVKNLRDKHLTVVDGIFDTMNNIAEEAVKVLTSTNENKYELLKDLTKINQALLVAIGVSHNTIDKVCSVANSNGLSTKLTGAGGGGYCIVLMPSTNDSSEVECLINTLKNEGFSALKTTLGGPGLTLH